MKPIVLLCGSNNVGKTKTLKKFFGESLTGRLKPTQKLKKGLNGKKIYAVSLSSPQEQSPFCVINEVKERIEKRIQKCGQASQAQDYTLIIPFTMYVKDGSINERCIMEPIEFLRAKGFKVFPIYLRKENGK